MNEEVNKIMVSVGKLQGQVTTDLQMHALVALSLSKWDELDGQLRDVALEVDCFGKDGAKVQKDLENLITIVTAAVRELRDTEAASISNDFKKLIKLIQVTFNSVTKKFDGVKEALDKVKLETVEVAKKVDRRTLAKTYVKKQESYFDKLQKIWKELDQFKDFKMFFRDFEDGEWSDEIRHFVDTLSKTLHVTDNFDPREDLENFKTGLEDDLDLDAGTEEDVYNYVNENWPDILEKSGKIFKHVHYLE